MVRRKKGMQKAEGAFCKAREETKRRHGEGYTAVLADLDIGLGKEAPKLQQRAPL